jgi:putative Mg2+ transporter-C (MgtC) family protein
VALRFIGLLEARSGWKIFPMLYEVRGTDENTMYKDILCALDKAHVRLNIVERDKVGEQERVTFTISLNAARHRQLLADLILCDSTDHVVSFRDEEED